MASNRQSLPSVADRRAVFDAAIAAIARHDIISPKPHDDAVAAAMLDDGTRSDSVVIPPLPPSKYDALSVSATLQDAVDCALPISPELKSTACQAQSMSSDQRPKERITASSHPSARRTSVGGGSVAVDRAVATRKDDAGLRRSGSCPVMGIEKEENSQAEEQSASIVDRADQVPTSEETSGAPTKASSAKTASTERTEVNDPLISDNEDAEDPRQDRKRSHELDARGPPMPVLDHDDDCAVQSTATTRTTLVRRGAIRRKAVPSRLLARALSAENSYATDRAEYGASADTTLKAAPSRLLARALSPENSYATDRAEYGTSADTTLKAVPSRLLAGALSAENSYATDRATYATSSIEISYATDRAEYGTSADTALPPVSDDHQRHAPTTNTARISINNTAAPTSRHHTTTRRPDALSLSIAARLLTVPIPLPSSFLRPGHPRSTVPHFERPWARVRREALCDLQADASESDTRTAPIAIPRPPKIHYQNGLWEWTEREGGAVPGRCAMEVRRETCVRRAWETEAEFEPRRIEAEEEETAARRRARASTKEVKWQRKGPAKRMVVRAKRVLGRVKRGVKEAHAFIMSS